MIRLQGFGTINLGLVKNPRWRPLLKIAKPSKSTFSPEPLDLIGYKFDRNINGTLVFKIMKIKKNTAGHSDLLYVYKSNFAQMPISRANVNVFCSDLITMVPKRNYFIFMQIDCPRWSPGAVTKNSINTKMTIS